MIIRKAPTTTPIDRPFPDENTVSEIYCNEAYTVDNEAVEDWSSSLQMLLIFAAIFSAVVVTLIVETRQQLEQDKTEVLVDAVVFLMNNLANGTHRPYTPPPFQPSTRNIVVNCFLFASLCLSIATALGAVLAMQWVTDYGAVTRRAGSTPEERVRRRHVRYQGGLDWKMDTIIGALPIALHLSVLLSFVGLIVWMWDVHRSVFAVVFVSGALAIVFYVLTIIVAIFCPSCPFRTPLAGGVYTLLHFAGTILARFGWSLERESGSEKGDEEGMPASFFRRTPNLRRIATSLQSRFAQPSLTSRDDAFIQNADNDLMLKSLIWLSNHMAISPDVHRRLLILVDEFSSVIDPDADIPSAVPWREIFHALGIVYQSFVQDINLDEDGFAEFARRTYCLSQPIMRRILETCFGTDDKLVDGVEFPVCLLHVWTKALSSHGTDALRKQRFSDEVVIQNVIGSISSNPRDLLKTWYDLLVDEEQTCSAILPHILSGLESVPREKIQKQLDTTLFMIYTGQLPWASSVPLYTDMTFPPTQLSRRLPVLNWVQALKRHRQKDFILEQIAAFKGKSPFRVLFQNKPTEEEEEELKQTGSTYPADLASPEDMMYRALLVFDKVLDDAVYDEESPISAEDMAEWIVNIIYKDLKDSNVHFNLEYFKVFGNLTKPKILRQMLSPILRLIACATLGLEWEEEWSPQLIKAKDYLRANEWKHVSSICLRNPPYYDGDRTNLWSLRLRLWTLFDGEIAHGSLHGLLGNLNNLKQVEQDLQSTRLLGTSKAGDLLLVLFHLNVAYSWGFLTISALYAVIPDTLIGDTTKIDAGGVSKECIEYLSVICEEISADPSRLIRLLIELVRADIGFHCTIRRPKILFDLLKHAKTHLSDKELRPFIPSCQRLRQYIKKSYGQYEKDWDAVPPQAYVDENPQTYYAVVDRAELKTLYGEVLTLLKPAGQWEGEVKNVAWPRELLRPIGGRKTGDSLVEPGFEELDTPDGEDNVVLAVVEEAVE